MFFTMDLKRFIVENIPKKHRHFWNSGLMAEVYAYNLVF